ncbi:MAG: putative inner membrane protein [Parcubacteria group bacterium Gr01-1014_31]|nr:MAG: putative inner membrane protein [Parcubacteria group bacterium Gr01-1014_31]
MGLLAALAVTFLLGLPYLGSEPLWFDEVLSWSVYRHSASPVEMIGYLAQYENHPPLYYLMMAGWIRAVGDSAFALRGFSLLFALLSVGLLYGLAREWFGRTTASAAAMAMALSPFFVEFSREARPYMMLTAFAIGGWFTLSRWQRTGSRAAIIGFGVLALAGLYTHYAYWFVLGSQVLAALMFIPRAVPNGGRQLAAALGGILFAYLPWVPVLAKNLLAQYRTVGDLTPLSSLTQPENFLPLDVVMNFLFFPSKWPVDAFGRLLQGSTLLLLAVGAGLVALIAWRRVRQGDAAATNRWQRLVLVGMWVVAPLLLFLVSPLSGRYSWYYQRHVLFVLPAVAVAVVLAGQELLARSRLGFSPTVVAAAVVCAYVLMNSPQYFTNDATWDPQHQFPAVVQAIEDQERGGRELIVGFWPNYRILLDYYYHGGQTVGSLVPEAIGSRQLTIASGSPRQTPVEGYLLTHPHIPYRDYRLPSDLSRYDRLWVVSVTPSLFDLDIALIAAGWTPTYVPLPQPLKIFLFRFDRLAGLCRPMAGS